MILDLKQRDYQPMRLARVVGRPRVITIASGKGGVGKTQLAVNLAIALSRQNRRVLLIDGDLGLANINVVLGIVPQYNVAHILDGGKSFRQALVRFEDLFDVLPAGTALPQMAELDVRSQIRFVERLSLYQQPYDVVLLDASGGIGANVRLSMAMADNVFVVLTPETTSLTDAYALVKVAERSGCKAEFSTVINRVRSAEEARNIYSCLDVASQSFLGIRVGYMGYVYRDDAVERAMLEQRPFLSAFPSAPASRCIEVLAQRMLEAVR